eukprot:1187728-Prorocentrum_minimum.AAC.3
MSLVGVTGELVSTLLAHSFFSHLRQRPGGVGDWPEDVADPRVGEDVRREDGHDNHAERPHPRCHMVRFYYPVRRHLERGGRAVWSGQDTEGGPEHRLQAVCQGVHLMIRGRRYRGPQP